MELVSVVVPVYNAENTIERAVKSLEQQTYTNIEIVLVNDGSKDDTDSICCKLAKKDSRIKYYSIDNSGVSNARNIGISHSNGLYIAFMDSDDYIEKNMIEELVSLMDEKTDLVCCGYKVVSTDNQMIFSKTPQYGKWNKKYAYKGIENLQECLCFNTLWNKLFRADIIKDNDLLLDVSISMGEDFLFIIDYLLKMTNEVKVISDSLYRYTLSNNGLQAKFNDGIDMRFAQLNRLKRLYLEEHYPLDGFYLEVLRTVYTSLVLEGDSKEKVRAIINLPICSELKKNNIQYWGKYKVLFELIKHGNCQIIMLAVRIYQIMKNLRGNAFNWNKKNKVF